MGGKFVVRAGQHKFESGERVCNPLPLLPKMGLYNLTYEVRDKDTQELLPFTRYVLTNEFGHSHYGETDENGLTETIYTDKEEKFSLHVFSNGEEDSSSKDDTNG